VKFKFFKVSNTKISYKFVAMDQMVKSKNHQAVKSITLFISYLSLSLEVFSSTYARNSEAWARMVVASFYLK